ncbi:MAG: alpha/beta hydrolase [Trueperaceae bacterium]|nr:alpha/beta hydrolase [Trueperaceae bacterium]
MKRERPDGVWLDEAAHVVVPGADLYVEQVGRPDAPAVYALHGGPGYSCHALRELLGEDLERYRTVYADQRGGGRSYADAPFDLDVLADDVAAVLGALGIADATLLAHGFGATIAVRAAVRHPARVRGLVLVNPWVSMPMLARTLQREAAHRSGRGEAALPPEAALADAEALDPQAHVDDAFGMTSAKALFDALLFPDAAARLRLEHADATALLGPTETVELDDPWRLDVRPDLAGVRAPVAVLVATRDGSAYPDQAEAALAGLPHGVTALVDGGHYPWLDADDAFLDTLHAALAHAGAAAAAAQAPTDAT